MRSFLAQPIIFPNASKPIQHSRGLASGYHKAELILKREAGQSAPRVAC
jgi:hypothetical protein